QMESGLTIGHLQEYVKWASCILRGAALGVMVNARSKEKNMTATAKTILSAIQPSGDMTLGNYLGAIRNHVKMASDPAVDALFFVVDQHAITVRQDPKLLRERTYNVVAWYLAAGLNPEACTLFVQSHVPQHTELAWLLGTFTQIGEL